MIQNTLKQLKKKDRTKLLKQLSTDLPSGCNVSTRNPAITSDMLKRITYIRNNADKLNPTELNEALKMLGFPLIDSWNPTIIDEQRRLLCSYLNEKTATGNPITLNIIGNLTPEVTGLKVTMNPIQDLHGYSNPWAGGAGKNLLDFTTQTITSSKMIASDIQLKAGTYTVAFNIKNTTSIEGYYSVRIGTTSLGGINFPANFTNRLSKTFTLSEDSTINILVAGASAGYSFEFSNGQIESGSTATDFAPYSNICPISGRDSVTVTRTAGEDVETHTHQYSETIYGGVDDFVNGGLSVEWGYIASYDEETLPGEWISDRDVYAPNTTPTIGAEVAYKLSEAVSIETTPEEITLLRGENVVSTDGDSIELKYKLSFT